MLENDYMLDLQRQWLHFRNGSALRLCVRVAVVGLVHVTDDAPEKVG
jgi:hypothetical protein